jgi:hypothetical protein
VAPRAVGILAACLLVPAGVGVVALVMVWPRMKAAIDEAQSRALAQQPGLAAQARPRVLRPSEMAAARGKVQADLHELQGVIEESERRLGRLPANEEALRAAWRLLRPGRDLPVDPFDKSRYGYVVKDGRYMLWSSGPDGESDTDDDIEAGAVRLLRG